MANPGSSAARIPCPKCRANNFAGKTHCWQCASPLPAPEAAGPDAAGAAPRPHTAPNPSQWPQSQSRPGAVPRGSAGLSPGYQGAPGQSQPGIYQDAFVRKWGMSRGIAGVIVAVGVGMFFIVWAVAGRQRGASDPLRDTTSAPAPVFAPAVREAPSEARPAPDDTDPLVAASKRFIERESRHAGLPEPPASSDGRVHLRGGGSISTEQYRDAQRHVQESPVLHSPIPAPPMP